MTENLLKSLAIGLGVSVAAAAYAAPTAVPSYADAPHSTLLERAMSATAEAAEMSNFTPGEGFGRSGDGLFRTYSSLEGRRERAAASAQAAARALASNVIIVGQMYDKTGWSKYDDPGFYELPHATGDPYVLKAKTSNTSGIANSGSYFDCDHTFYGLYCEIDKYGLFTGYMITLDSQKWTFSKPSIGKSSATPLRSEAVAYDPTEGKAYGFSIWEDGVAPVWRTLNYAAKTYTDIATLSADAPHFTALVCTDQGQFYAITSDSKLMSIDKATGAYTLVAETSLPQEDPYGATYSAKTGKIYATANTSSQQALYEIDPATGTTTLIAEMPDNARFRNLFINPPLAEDKAPAAPTATLSAPEGTMTVSYNIHLADALYDGTPSQAAMSWTITAVKYEGSTAGSPVVVAEGKNQAGTVVDGTFTLEDPAKYEFTVYAHNDDGDSPKVKDTFFVGPGIPKAPTSVKLAFADNKLTLTWGAVTASTDGGYIGADDVTYTITDGENVVAENVKGTSWSKDTEAPVYYTSWTYSVKAVYAGKESSLTKSNTVTMGGYQTPFSTTFDFTDSFTNHGYTVSPTYGTCFKPSENGARCSGGEYSAPNAWLITPPIHLEGGKAYEFSALVSSSREHLAEQFEVKMGTAATTSAMTTEVIPVSTLACTVFDPETRTGVVTVETTGDYYFGIHLCTPEYDRYNARVFTVHSLTISDGINPDSPKAVTSLSVTPDATGELKATVAFNMPSENIAGTALSGSLTANIYRNGDLAATRTAAPGAAVSYVDTVDKLGDYTYSVDVTSGENTGFPVSAKAYVGPYAPLPPAHASVFETYQPGTVTVVWDAVTEDINGSVLSPANVTYMVYGLGDDNSLIPMLDEPTSATQATFQALSDPDKQMFAQYVVASFNRGLRSNQAVSTDVITVGNPYTLPVTYSDTADLNKYILGTATSNSYYTEWGVITDEAGIPSQDGDGIMFAFYSKYPSYGYNGDLYTGRISLIGVDHPQFECYIYKANDADTNTWDLYVMVDGQAKAVTTFKNSTMMTTGWNKCRVALDEYVGKNVEFILRATVNSFNYAIIDNISIAETPEYDIEASEIYAPATVATGEKFDVRVSVVNNGYADAADFKVALYRNGDVDDTRDVAGLAVGEKMDILFENEITLFDNVSAEFTAEVIYENDMVAANNVTTDVLVERLTSILPTVTLAGEATDGGNLLTWTPVDFTTLDQITKRDDFESAESWADQVSGWTILDVDGKGIGAIEGITLPNHEEGDKAGFFVFDNTLEALEGNESFDAYSGHKFLATMYLADGDPNDDWLISPLLSGKAQTISFHAASYNGNYPEKIEILYTTDDSLDPADYTSVKVVDQVPMGWTEITAQLPEGALRFAIRSCGEDTFLLMVDDITYNVAATQENMPALIGYNIYRDGVQLNAETLTVPTYTDTDVKDGASHTYNVTALYAEGSSELSNSVSLQYSSLASISAETGCTVTVDGFDIVVKGAGSSSVAIFTVDGRCIFTATGDTRTAVTPAVYIVAVGKTTRKVIVTGR